MFDPAANKSLFPAILSCLPLVLTILAAVFSGYAFYPGYLSTDSLVQFEQVLGHLPVQNLHPPIMVYVWRFMNMVVWGAGGMFGLQVAAYWAAIYLWARLIFKSPVTQALLVVGAGFWPPTYMLSLHLWKDAGMMIFLALGCVILLWARRQSSRFLVFLALPALFYGAAVRHNAFLAAAPLLFLAVWVWEGIGLKALATPPRRADPRALWIKVGLIAAMFLALIRGINTIRVEPVEPWGTIMVWDLAAMSIREKSLLLTPTMLSEAYRTAESSEVFETLKRKFDPRFNHALAGVLDFYPRGEWKTVWFGEVWRHKGAYLAHRWEVIRNLLGIGKPVCYPYHSGIDANPYGIDQPHRTSRMAGLYLKIASACTRTPVYTGWLYLCVIIAALVLALGNLGLLGNRVGRVDPWPLGLISSSGILSVAGLPLMAPACDFRYLSWMVFSAGICIGLFCADGNPSDDGGIPEP